jgi:hypothetical protein
MRRPVVETDRGDGQDMTRREVEFEGVLELDRADRPTLGAEPAFGRDGFPVEAREGGRDLGVRAQILSITCLTTV